MATSLTEGKSTAKKWTCPSSSQNAVQLEIFECCWCRKLENWNWEIPGSGSSGANVLAVICSCRDHFEEWKGHIGTDSCSRKPGGGRNLAGCTFNFSQLSRRGVSVVFFPLSLSCVIPLRHENSSCLFFSWASSDSAVSQLPNLSGITRWSPDSLRPSGDPESPSLSFFSDQTLLLPLLDCFTGPVPYQGSTSSRYIFFNNATLAVPNCKYHLPTTVQRVPG